LIHSLYLGKVVLRNSLRRGFFRINVSQQIDTIKTIAKKAENKKLNNFFSFCELSKEIVEPQ